jgi:hypothetical protein
MAFGVTTVGPQPSFIHSHLRGGPGYFLPFESNGLSSIKACTIHGISLPVEYAPPKPNLSAMVFGVGNLQGTTSFCLPFESKGRHHLHCKGKPHTFHL